MPLRWPGTADELEAVGPDTADELEAVAGTSLSFKLGAVGHVLVLGRQQADTFSPSPHLSSVAAFLDILCSDKPGLALHKPPESLSRVSPPLLSPLVLLSLCFLPQPLSSLLNMLVLLGYDLGPCQCSRSFLLLGLHFLGHSC